MSFDFGVSHIKLRSSVRPIISLVDAKRMIFGINEKVINNPTSFVDGVVNRIIMANTGTRLIDIAQARLQTLCTVGNVEHLKYFLVDFTNTNGIVATELLVNGHIRSGNGIPHCNTFYMTPVLCSLLWNSSPEIIRVLYAYGAKIHIPDLHNVFPEEKLLTIPYFDHLCGTGYGAESGISSPMWRNHTDFTIIISEIRALSSEVGPVDPGWFAPPMQVV